MLSKEVPSTLFLSLWYNLTWRLNPSLPDHWRTLYSLSQWPKIYQNQYYLFPKCLDGLVPWYINLHGFFFNAKAIFLEEESWYYLIHSWGGVKGFLTFPKGICPKVIVTVWLEFELAFYNVKVHHLNHNAMETPSPSNKVANNFV